MAGILECLVALNAEQAAEEARCLVRWLRPAYQAPGAREAEAVPLEMNTVESRPKQAGASARHPWPKDLKPQMAALRGLLHAPPKLWSLESITQTFNGRSREAIEGHLEVLLDLGVIGALETS